MSGKFKKRIFSPVEIDGIVQLYGDGYSIYTLYHLYHTSSRFIAQILTNAGITIRNSGVRSKVIDGKKECSLCHNLLDVKCFYNKPITYNKLSSECRNCRYNRSIVKKFGITIDEYNTILHHQNGVCGICQKKPEMNKLAVDHDHKSGEIRGLLCIKCNTALGLLNEDVLLFDKAISYLKLHRTV